MPRDGIQTSPQPREITVASADLGPGTATRGRVRDVWRWKELGTVTDRYAATVGRHGVVLVRMWPARPGGK